MGGVAMTGREAARVLREILQSKRMTARHRRGLELAISVLEARAFDGVESEKP